MIAALAEPQEHASTVESIVARVKELGLRMSAVDGRLVLEGNISLLSPGEREAIRMLKVDLIEQLTAQRPLGMWVANDLEHWTTDEPHYWAEAVTINGKKFVRVTGTVIAWFKDRIAKAEAACAAGKLDLDAFGAIIKAFCPVYEFAVEAGLIPDPVTKQVRQAGRAQATGPSQENSFFPRREVVPGRDFVARR